MSSVTDGLYCEEFSTFVLYETNLKGVTYYQQSR